MALERDKAMTGMLRRSLAANDATPRAECPGTDVLAAYYEHSLDAEETSRCDIHLAECSQCRQQMAIMAKAEAPPQKESHHAWIWDWRLLAAAASILVIATVWGLRRPAPLAPVAKTANQPLVAMSKPEEAAPQPRLSLTAPVEQAKKSTPAPAPNRISRVPQLSTPQLPKALREEPATDLPLNGRNYSELGKLKPQAESNGADATIAQSPSVGGAAPTAAPPAAPSGSLQSNSTLNQAGQDAVAEAKQAPALDASKTQAQPAARVNSYGRLGAANQAALGQAAQQRSAETIIATPDPNTLWRIAGSGFIERSEDEGATWHGQSPEPNARLTGGSAPTAKICWLVGEDGVILLTKDGIHWKKIPPPIPSNFIAVTAKNASTATVTAAGGQKFSTSDGGKKWKPSQ
jgi:hypothetical protein